MARLEDCIEAFGFAGVIIGAIVGWVAGVCLFFAPFVLIVFFLMGVI
jgi:hypothetical protein